MSNSRKSRFLVLLILLLAVFIAVGIILLRKKTPVEENSGAAAESGSASSAKKAGGGWIEVKGADFIGHEVRDAATGAVVAKIDALQSTLALPAGTYDVGFGATDLKGVTVKEGEKMVLEPGAITVNHASLKGHDVVASGTGVVQGRVSAIDSHLVLLPGAYDVKFGPLSWPVEVKAGETTVLDPGLIEVRRADINGHKIHDLTGALIGEVSATGSVMPLPPGDYTIELDGKTVSFTIKAGEKVTLERK